MNKKTLTKIIAPLVVLGALTYPAKEAYEFHQEMSNLAGVCGVAAVVDELSKSTFNKINTEYGKAYMNKSPDFTEYDIPDSKYFESVDSDN